MAKKAKAAAPKKPTVKKQSGDAMSTLAARILSGEKEPTSQDAKRLAASVLSQDEKKGKRN